MKSMKKSMFVTTILMVVLLIVALSTATFAWYTAQSGVDTTATTAHSAASNAASLAIDKTADATSSNSRISLTLSKSIEPMVPTAKPTGETTFTAFTTSGYFITAPIDNEGNFATSPSNTVPAIISQIGGEAQATNDFYVINTNSENDATVNAQVSFGIVYTVTAAEPDDWDTNYTDYYTESSGTYTKVTGAEAPEWAASTYYSSNENILNDLRVAMFVGGTYLNTWSYAGSDCYYGSITNGNSGILASHDYTTQSNATNVSIGSIAALGSKNIKLAVWFDGVGLKINEADTDVTFTVSFSISASTPHV